MGTSHEVQDRSSFYLGKNNWQSSLPFGSFDAFDVRKSHFQDIAVEEEDGAESLVLGGSSDVFFDGQMREKTADVLGSQGSEVLLLVEAPKASNPLKIGLFGPDTQMFEAGNFPDCIPMRRNDVL